MASRSLWPFRAWRRLFGSSVGAVALILVFRAETLPSQQHELEFAVEVPDIDPVEAARRLAAALREPTISGEVRDPEADAAFARLLRHIEDSFPTVHQVAIRERVGDYSLLYRWEGRDPSLDPILLMGHIDVVPAPDDPAHPWTHPPFGGVIADGFVWGRGALDDKVSVMAQLEAVERLAQTGFRPGRTVYLAFGHDEEVGGHEGAARIAALLQRRGLRLRHVLDEGGVISSKVVPGVDDDVAVVGIAEKGYASVELTVTSAGGHSSVPPERTAIGILSDALARLQDEPLPSELREPSRRMFEALAPEMPLHYRLALGNLWLTELALELALGSDPATDAMLRTTAAVTMIEGGTKDNVLPTHARAVVNYRIAPGDTVDTVLEHVRDVVDDDRVEIRVLPGARDPSGVSGVESEAYATLVGSIRATFPGTVVVPYLVVAGTDSRHFAPIADEVHRFLPVRIGRDDKDRIHGVDERVSIEDYAAAIAFYMTFIQAASR